MDDKIKSVFDNNIVSKFFNVCLEDHNIELGNFIDLLISISNYIEDINNLKSLDQKDITNTYSVDGENIIRIKIVIVRVHEILLMESDIVFSDLNRNDELIVLMKTYFIPIWLEYIRDNKL